MFQTKLYLMVKKWQKICCKNSKNTFFFLVLVSILDFFKFYFIKISAIKWLQENSCNRAAIKRLLYQRNCKRAAVSTVNCQLPVAVSVVRQLQHGEPASFLGKYGASDQIMKNTKVVALDQSYNFFFLHDLIGSTSSPLQLFQ